MGGWVRLKGTQCLRGQNSKRNDRTKKEKRSAIEDAALCFFVNTAKGTSALGCVRVFLNLEGLKRLRRKEVLHIELLGREALLMVVACERFKRFQILL